MTNPDGGFGEHVTDFAGWVRRACAFTESLADVPGAAVESASAAPPIAEGEAAALERALGRPLDARAPADDPPVLYLSHDEESAVVSASFTDFMDVWQRLCYVGPEIWLLAEFLTPTGHLSAEDEKAERLRGLLGDAA